MSKYYVSEKIKIETVGKEIELLIFRPTVNAKDKANTPGILWIHGGGYVTGMAKMIYMSRAMNLVKKYGAVVVTPEYRLSKEAPYPAALQDCYAALKYLKEHAEELGVNSSQIMVGGESAGGGLTAALCMYARDKGEVNIAYQMPLYPMMDNLDTNLPPAYTFVGDIEPFYCETLTYIENLKKAGVEASVDVYPNCFHAFDMLLPFKKVSKQAIAEFERQYLEACEKYYAEQDK